jgi:hypothetical protein
MRTLAEILQVADDAQIEGRTAMVNHNAIVEAAGTLRRIANRLASMASGRMVALPPLDSVTESARQAVLEAIRAQLSSWLDFFSAPKSLVASATRIAAASRSPDDLATPLQLFSSRLEERQFARTESWTVEQRRTILAELQSMRRLEFLISELNRWLAQIPSRASNRLSRARIGQA